MKSIRRWLIALVIIAMLFGGGAGTMLYVQPAQAFGVGTLLRIGGVLLVVNTFGGQIDHFVNNLLGQRKAELAGATKVVPIFSVGRGAFVGAAQVVGLPENVRHVRAVGAVDVKVGNISGTGLVPIATQRPSGRGGLTAVNGVGVSAIIEIHL